MSCLKFVLPVLLLAGCATSPPPDTARVGPNAFGNYANNDVNAMHLAAWAFASPARTRNRPVDAARAVAALDYMAGELSTNPRWTFINPIWKQQMLQARVAVRHALGIAPDAPSQIVVDDLLAAADALLAGQTEAAQKALPPPTFPPDLLARLSNLPYVQIANLATIRADTEVTSGRPGGSGMF